MQINYDDQEKSRLGAPRKGRRCRRIGSLRRFKPAGIPAEGLATHILELDEFEAIRLCDLDGLNQIEAGTAMGVSRGTVQRLLKSGRAKIAAALLRGEVLAIDEHMEEVQ